MNVTLVGDVENEAIFWGIEDAVEGDRQFDNAEVGPEMSADGARIFFGKNANEFVADFLSELGKVVLRERFDVCG
jgi:hypothetical protein